MSKNKVIALKKPGEFSADPLRLNCSRSVEIELQQLLSQYASLKNEQGHQQVVQNGYLP